MSNKKQGFDAVSLANDASNEARNKMLADIEERRLKRQAVREAAAKPTPAQIAWEENERRAEAWQQAKASKAAAYRKRVIEGTGYDLPALKNLSLEQTAAAFEKAKEDFMFEQDVKKAKVEILELLYYYKDGMEKAKQVKADKIEYTKRLYAEGKANLPPNFMGETDPSTGTFITAGCLEDAQREWLLTHPPISLEEAIKKIEEGFDGVGSYGISLNEAWRTQTILPQSSHLTVQMLRNFVNSTFGG